MFKIMVKRIKGFPYIFDSGYPTIVNHNASIEDLLKVRHYDRVAPEINSKNFPSEKGGKEQIVIKVIKLDCRPVFGDPRFEGELISIEGNGYEVVDLRELLTALNQHKNIRAVPSILALGSRIDIDDSLVSPFVKEQGCLGSSVGFEEV